MFQWTAYSKSLLSPKRLKEIVDDYSFNLLGDNRDFEYAVHWNKEKTNLHAHIIYSERERQKKEPKRYKRDYYYNYEEGKMSSKKDPNAVITKHKGDIKYNKEGEIEYTDQLLYFYQKGCKLKLRLDIALATWYNKVAIELY